MKIWLITDTHFGHKKIIEYENRPENFEEIIFENLKKSVKDDDLLIHLGDVAFSNASSWHLRLYTEIGCRKWLVRGNHDHKSDEWYLNHGWGFSGNSFTMGAFGKNILFTHVPVKRSSYLDTDVNIHGHLHSNAHRLEEVKDFYDPFYNKLLAIEAVEYEPVLLESFLNESVKP